MPPGIVWGVGMLLFPFAAQFFGTVHNVLIIKPFFVKKRNMQTIVIGHYNEYFIKREQRKKENKQMISFGFIRTNHLCRFIHTTINRSPVNLPSQEV